MQATLLQPALHALAEIREELTGRVGKQGGNLNGRFQANLNVIETTLQQFGSHVEQTQTLITLANQQAELAVRATRDLARLTGSTVRDDGVSESKGH